MKGFVTLATGNIRYFRMAVNLLQSYRFFAKDKYPFAIIADKENEYTKLFDKVVLIKDAQGTYMDKIKLLNNCPYDENIFIDADCLVYKDLNEYWECFRDADDFSCFGSALPLNSQKGLFKREDIGEYKDKIKFVTHLHGVVYFIRKGKLCEELLKTCYYIIDNYDHYYFEFFKEPADESVFALAMAIHNCHPVKRKTRFYVFLPVAKRLKADISRGYLSYTILNGEKTETGMLVHWANVNTKKAVYKRECYKLQKIISGYKINKIEIVFLRFVWKSKDFIYEIRNKLYELQGIVKSRIYELTSNDN